MYSVNRVHFYFNFIPLSYLFAITTEPLSIVKSILILKTQDMLENTRCLDLSNATALSLFAMLCGTNITAKLSSYCLHRRHPRRLTCIYVKSKYIFDRLSPYWAFAVRQLWGLPAMLTSAVNCE